jgi:hypothetical protein
MERVGGPAHIRARTDDPVLWVLVSPRTLPREIYGLYQFFVRTLQQRVHFISSVSICLKSNSIFLARTVIYEYGYK